MRLPGAGKATTRTGGRFPGTTGNPAAFNHGDRAGPLRT